MNMPIDLTNDVIVDLLFPSFLYDADGKHIEGKAIRADLGTGTVWFRGEGIDPETNDFRVYTEKHKAPLELRSRDTMTVITARMRKS